MPRAGHSHFQSRTPFEAFEERLALTAQALTALELPVVETHELVTENAAALPMMDQPIVPHAASSAASMAGGHGWTEVAYARSEFGLSGAGQTVVVIDSGIAYDHVALGNGFGAGARVAGGWDFAENDANPYDDGPAGFHGTHVAGIIGSSDKKYTGVAPGVDLVALRVFTDQGAGNFSYVEQALQWVHNHQSDFANPITTVNLSLGTTWNAENVPNWSTIEDELQTLSNDGIFISVSAGNSFKTYGTPGLSYPAASPYVVPVASVDASGNLSAFSQRDSRVIAAPGERIMSTVPDYYLGADGVNNDFSAASGTSMAAPYVAGASVLIREALGDLGQTNVDQQVIYDILRNTADVIFDAATSANYRRLNLQKALDSIVGADDFGSTEATAEKLGALSQKLVVSGTIGRLSDQDFFTFTASQSGSVTIAAETTGKMATNWQLQAGAATSGGKVTMNVVAGESYTVGLGTKGGIGKYTLNVEFVAPPGNPVTPTNPGSPTHPGTPTNPPPPGLGNNVEVFGTEGNDVFTWTAATPTSPFQTYTVNGVSHTAAASARVVFHGGGGEDSITLIGGEGAESITMRPGTVRLSSATYIVSADSVENTRVVGDYRDTAYLYDSAGNDTFEAGTATATLKGSGYCQVVEGFGNVTAYASGGHDMATLYDSVGNDTFIADPQSASLRGNGFANYARSFDAVRAYAVAGGHDTATLTGSSGNDLLTTRGTLRLLTGSGFSIQAGGFETATISGTSGIDRAEFNDLGKEDLFYGRQNVGRLTAAAVATEVIDFNLAIAISRTGQKAKSDVQAVDYLFQEMGG